MRRFIIFLVLLFFFIFQLTLMPRLTVFGVFPNILLAAILVLAAKSSENFSLIAAFLSGLGLDFFSGLPFGVWAISFAVLVWLIQTIGKSFFKNSDLFGQICLIGGALMFFIFFLPFLIKFFSWFGLGVNLSFWQNILRRGWMGFILNFILVLILLLALNQFYGLRRRI